MSFEVSSLKNGSVFEINTLFMFEKTEDIGSSRLGSSKRFYSPRSIDNIQSRTDRGSFRVRHPESQAVDLRGVQ